jgi:hypothetical protein
MSVRRTAAADFDRFQDEFRLAAYVKGYQMPAAESRRSTKTPHWTIAVEPAGYSDRR